MATDTHTHTHRVIIALFPGSPPDLKPGQPGNEARVIICTPHWSNTQLVADINIFAATATLLPSTTHLNIAIYCTSGTFIACIIYLLPLGATPHRSAATPFCNCGEKGKKFNKPCCFQFQRDLKIWSLDIQLLVKVPIFASALES